LFIYSIFDFDKQKTIFVAMSKLKNITLALLCLWLLSFCKRASTTWDDDLVAPLATGNLSLGNLFPDTVIKANTDSTLKIEFTSNLINYGLDSLLKIPDTTIVIKDTNGIAPIHLPGGPSTNTIFSTAPADNNYNFPSGIQLKKVIVRKGYVDIKLYNTYRQPLLYEYQLPSATKNGIPLDTTFYITGATSGSVPGTTTCSINLSGYTIDFTGSSHHSYNTITQGGNLSTATNALSDTIYSGQGLRAYFTFHNLVPQYALGYFGSQSISAGPDTTAFTGFSAIKKGILNLNSATVGVTINNQFGVFMKASISNISSINTNNPSTVHLTTTPGSLLSNIFVNSAVNTGSGALPTIVPITLNNSNSNVVAFIGNLPNKLSYKLNAQINPPIGGNSNQSGSNDFGYYGTSFSASLYMDVPLFFSASNLMLADTVSLNLSTISELKNINKGNLILTATNSYPFSINLSAILLNEYKQPLDVLFSTPSLIEAPPLDANNKVISPLKSKLYVPLTPQKISNLQKAKYVSYTATFNTANQPNQIKFYSNYTLGLLLTADLNYTIGK